MNKIVNTEVLHTLEYACWVCAILSGIAAAWFRVLSASLPEAKRELLQERYRLRWQVLHDSGYLELPERGVKWLLRFKSRPVKWSQSFFDKLFGPVYDDYNDSLNPWVAFGLLLGPGSVSIWILYGGVAFSAFIGIFTLASILLIVGSKYLSNPEWLESMLFFVMGLYAAASYILTFQVAFSFQIHWAALILFAAIPVFSVLFLATMSILYEKTHLLSSVVFDEPEIMNLGFAFALSFFITALALLFGSLAVPEAHLPHTMQMFLVNVLCDGITLLLTFAILEGAVHQQVREQKAQGGSEDLIIKRMYSIPVAIVMDLVVAAFLACIALYFGLLGTKHALSISEAVYVLVGLDTSGSAFELGPYFWAMHTTFIPTLIYLSVITLAYIGKLIILPVFEYYKKAHAVEKPHQLTFALFALVAVVFYGLADCIGRIIVG